MACSHPRSVDLRCELVCVLQGVRVCSLTIVSFVREVHKLTRCEWANPFVSFPRVVTGLFVTPWLLSTPWLLVVRGLLVAPGLFVTPWRLLHLGFTSRQACSQGRLPGFIAGYVTRSLLVWFTCPPPSSPQWCSRRASWGASAWAWNSDWLLASVGSWAAIRLQASILQ